MTNTKHSFDTVAGLVLICVFALSLFFALAAGAGLYKDVGATMEYQYTARTAMGYVTEKAHQYNADGAVSTDSFEGCPALLLREEADGLVYITYIYCYDGYIRELFCQDGIVLPASAGESVIAADSLDFSLDGGLLRIDCVTGGTAETAYVDVMDAVG